MLQHLIEVIKELKTNRPIFKINVSSNDYKTLQMERMGDGVEGVLVFEENKLGMNFIHIFYNDGNSIIKPLIPDYQEYLDVFYGHAQNIIEYLKNNRATEFKDMPVLVQKWAQDHAGKLLFEDTDGSFTQRDPVCSVLNDCGIYRLSEAYGKETNKMNESEKKNMDAYIVFDKSKNPIDVIIDDYDRAKLVKNAFPQASIQKVPVNGMRDLVKDDNKVYVVIFNRNNHGWTVDWLAPNVNPDYKTVNCFAVTIVCYVVAKTKSEALALGYEKIKSFVETNEKDLVGSDGEKKLLMTYFQGNI